MSTLSPPPPAEPGTEQSSTTNVTDERSASSRRTDRGAGSNVVGYLLVLFGTFFLIVTLVPTAAYALVASFWPIALILLGIWLVARDRLVFPARQAVGALLLLAVALGGALALAAAIAGWPSPVGEPLAPIGQATVLTSPVAPGQTLRITNLTGGSTRVIAGDAGQVRAQVTRQPGLGPPASVDLGPSNGGVTLDARSAGAWPGQSPAASLVVEAPRDAPIVVETSGGGVVVDDRGAAVQVRGSSGSLMISRVDGPATLETSSRSIRASDVTGTFDARASSGSIDGTGLRHPGSVETSSGSIHLSGTFTDVVGVRATSGSIALGLALDSSTRISATTSSGSIFTGALTLANVSRAPHQLAGTLGAGAGTLTIETSSGSVWLDALR